MLGVPIGLLLLGWAPMLLVGGAAFYLGLRVVRAFERRSAATAELVALQERLSRLEETVGGVSNQVERLVDGQEFTTRLLNERK